MGNIEDYYYDMRVKDSLAGLCAGFTAGAGWHYQTLNPFLLSLMLPASIACAHAKSRVKYERYIRKESLEEKITFREKSKAFGENLDDASPFILAGMVVGYITGFILKSYRN